MLKLGQSVYRHIIATSGVTEMINAIKTDIESNYFKSRITMHFSLHATRDRGKVMPIDMVYPFDMVIEQLRKVSEVSGEKICLGFLLFNNFKPKGLGFEYTTKLEDLNEIFSIADSEHFRFSFCEYNGSPDIGTSQEFSEHEANRICEYTKGKGYESKLFSSFGKEEETACGMLAGKLPEHSASLKWVKLEKYAEELIDEALLHM